MENSAVSVIKLIILGVIAVCLVWILVILLGKGNFNFNISKSDKTKLLYDEVYKEEIKNIDIDVIDCDVKFEKSDSNEVNVKIYDVKKQEDKIDISLENETLKIVNKRELDYGIGFFLTNIGKAPRIIVTVPKDNKYNLTINGVSSDINIESNMNKVNIETKSGDISLKDADDVTIKSTSGDIAINDVSTLTIKTTSGDIELGKINNKLKINTTSGDIDIRELELSNNSSIKAVSGDIAVSKTNDIYVDAHTTSGDVSIDKNNRNSDVELKINTTSGDIEVKR